MAEVVVKVIGGKAQDMNASTVEEVKQKLGALTHTATINGEPVDDSYSLEDNDFLSLAPAVKGNFLSRSQAIYLARLAN